MKIIALSDNHSDYGFETPEGDILIHAGDFSYQGLSQEIYTFAGWLKRQPHEHKLFIWGNHELIESDELYYRNFIEENSGAKCIHTLREPLEINGVKFWGSSYTPTFGNWAFMKDDKQRKGYWEIAPDDVDVVVCHGPMWGMLDTVDGLEIEPGKLEHLGCVHLRNYIERVKPRLFIHGHIHDSGRQTFHLKHWDGEPDTICVNAALMDENYKIAGNPIEIEI